MFMTSSAINSITDGRMIAPIGTIVNSDSHIQYWCQVYGPLEVASPPAPGDFSFGQFVQISLPHMENAPSSNLVGVIYDTVLVNPAFGSMGPRLSTNDEQRAIFSPDYLSERATLIRILALGTFDASGQIYHGIPDLALELGASVTPMNEENVRNFHIFADHPNEAPYLHMGYLPQLIGQPTGLLPQTALRVLDTLQRLFPEHTRLLTIVRRNLAWKMAVETAG
jgi:hypothetical protein